MLKNHCFYLLLCIGLLGNAQKDANQKFELRGFSAQGTIHKFGKTKGQEERIGKEGKWKRTEK